MLYDNFRSACSARGTTLTEALEAIGRASGATGRWSKGSYPNLKIAMELADYLAISLDELCYGPAKAGLTTEEAALLSVYRHIPEEKRQLCIDFLRTHIADDTPGRGLPDSIKKEA